ncbi:two-component regulator propeller domain-containing protein [Roseateles sp. DC23W]|uniref:Two-component regulator propeller domain-containing protein n=1 Tax=Pelomonas dachongensis TaxID=3299029 RepID=A0ABW7EQJ9_9BURK
MPSLPASLALPARITRWLCPALLGLLGLLGLLAAAAPARATSPPGALVEFKHVAWSLERGAPSRINSIDQTPDGFLWIGSVEGLFRFDGVSFEPVPMAAPDAQRLVVSRLRATRAGDLWVGLARGRGVARFHDERLVDAQMPHPSREVNDIQEDADGGVWVARGGRSDRQLARFHQGAWQELGPDSGLPAQQVWDLHFARDGTMWVVLSNTLALRRPGEVRFSTLPVSITPRASLSEDAEGGIWIADASGTRALQRPATAATAFAHPNRFGGTRLLFDRHGDLWTTTWNNGVMRIRAPGRVLATSGAEGDRIASLNASAGLTSDQTRALFQDREGNVWVGTELGLDLLRPASVIVEPGLPPNSPTSYRLAATRDGTVYVADAQALYVMPPGQPPRRVLANGSPAEALCAAGAHGVWLFLADRVLRIEGGTVQRRPKPAGATAFGCAEDREGRLWMPGLERGLHWLQGDVWQRWLEPLPSPSLPANAALDREGRAVLLFRGRAPPGDTPFLALDATQSRAGGIEGLLPADAGVLVSGSLGLARAGDATGAVWLSSQTHPWAASLNGLAQTADGDTWAIGDAGIVQLRSSDLAGALREPGVALPHRVLDFQDGLNSFVQKAPGAQVAVGGDGRVWFLTRRNVVRINPAALVSNRLPPPVVLRSVQVGEQVLPATPQVTLPAGTTTVRVAFTALSLTMPGRVQFRHRLAGADGTWSAASPQRSTLLSDLRPGTYRFEVSACNNDGLWSAQTAELTLIIPATLTQSLEFRLAMAALAALLLYGLYLMRLRQIVARVRERGEERSRERERIARDMHDTLLQSVQGLILRLQSVADGLQSDPPAQQAINQALDRAEAVLVEGRDRLQGLRHTDTSDLEREVSRLIAELPFAQTTQVSVASQGQRRTLQPPVFDEILCIVSEALFNAARHAGAREVVVQVDYGRRWLEVEVRDDGVGVSPEKAAQAGRNGHYGMLGMRERAERIGGQFRISGHSGGGTRVSLRIKAAVAYARRAS